MNKELRPETNNLRRLFIKYKYHSIKAMAIELEENPKSFRRYFQLINPVIPQLGKLQKWSRILQIEIAEFFYICEPIPWPRPLKLRKTVRKKGLPYRKTQALRKSLRLMVAENNLNEEELSWFLNDDE